MQPTGAYWLGGAYANAAEVKGSITIMDPATGKKGNQKLLPHAIYSGVTATAGSVAFTTTVDGKVYALDDVTLKPLWSFNTGS
jgi:alcohol dehydrogenase (cytochrome c)